MAGETDTLRTMDSQNLLTHCIARKLLLNGGGTMMDVMETRSIDRNEVDSSVLLLAEDINNRVLEKLARMKRELARKERKLERFKRAQRARAHVKQKLREQALVDGHGQSPSFGQQEDKDKILSVQKCSLTPTSQHNTNENCSGCISDVSISRETTPRLHQTNHSFLARLGQANSQSLPSNFDLNFKTSKSIDMGRCESIFKHTSVCPPGSLTGDTETAISDNTDKEVPFERCKITISPDLLEDFPVISCKTKKQKTFLAKDDILNNSLHLTPALHHDQSGKSKKMNKQILENTQNDLKDVKLKLDFEMGNASAECSSAEKSTRSLESFQLEKEENSKDLKSNIQLNSKDENSGSIKSICPHALHDNFAPQPPLNEKVLSLSKKRKSFESGDHRRNDKKFKFHCDAIDLDKDNNTHWNQIEKFKFANCKLKNYEENHENLIAFEKAKSCQSDSCDALLNNDSMSVVSDSVSPQSSQSILKTVESLERNEGIFKNKENCVQDSTTESSVEDNLSSVPSDLPVRQCKKQGKRKNSVLKKRITKQQMDSPRESEKYLDFTELDVIPFSQFQYLDCLFSSQDILSETVQGKKGRKSHFGMLIQRRSPRLSSGLKNIAGDDIKCVDANSMTSTASDTQDTGSSHRSQLPAYCRKSSRGIKKTKKAIMISSVFQFIIDETKRKHTTEEFVLPCHMFNKELVKRLSSSASCGVPSRKSANPITDNKLQAFVDLPTSVKSEINSPQTKVYLKSAGEHEIDTKAPLKMSVKMEDVSVKELNDCQNESLLKEVSVHGIAQESSESQTMLKTTKLGPSLLSTPKHEPSSFTTPKHPSRHIPIPKPEIDLFTTPKQQIRKHEFDQFDTDILTNSPSLFPSQEPKEDVSSLFLSPVTASKASPFGVADLPVDGNCVVDDTDDVLLTLAKLPEEEAGCLEDDDDGGSRTLKTLCSFQTSKKEPVISVLCGVLHTAGSLVDFIVTLSTSSLGIWSLEGCVWTNELDWILPADCEAKSVQLIPSEDKVVALVSGSSVKVPVMFSVFVYDWLSGESTRFNLPLPLSLACPLSEGLCCPLTDRQIAVFYQQANFTNGQKFTLNSSFTATVDDIGFDKVHGQLKCVSPILDISQAIVSLSSESVLHIWNHESGMLLQSVDISICCPSAEHLASVHSEQGFLLLTVCCAEPDRPVSLIAVNPKTSACSQVLPFSQADRWQGVRFSAMYEDFLIASDESGSLTIWDTCSGELLGSRSKLQISSLAVDPSKEQIISGQKDGCVHIYQLS